ncbi:MAG TPA: hypothetical protein ENN80_15190 [Candidatus Hydrogenedentes bacterium]|nr:hypothetical protein [Candidatus Hydrogenedentota bacterium]
MGLSKKQLKTVAELERRVEMTREFMNDWLLFNQILSAYPSEGANKAQLENQFLKIKSKLAREHKVLKDTLMADYGIDREAMNIVSGATSLEAIYSQSEVAIKKLQNEWHRAFISINETLGGLEDKKARAEAGEKIFLMPSGGTGGGGGGAKGPGMSERAKKNLVIAVVLIGILVASMLIPQVRNLYLSSIDDVFGTSLAPPPQL